MKKIILFIFVFFVIKNISFSQEQTLKDSLINLINLTKEPSQKVDLYNELAWELKYENFDEAFGYEQKAINISKKVKYSKGEALAFKNIGGMYYLKDDYANSFVYYDSSLVLYKELNDSVGISKVTRNMGSIMSQQGKYDEAIEYYLTSLDIKKSLKDTAGVATNYNSIGLVYLEQGESMRDLALQNFKMALQLSEKINFREGEADSYFRIGTIYSNSKKTIDSALIYYNKFLNIAIELNEETLIAQAYEGLGLISKNKKDFEKAIVYYSNCKEILIKLDNNFSLASIYNNLGDLYVEKQDYQNALFYTLKANDLSVKYTIPVVRKQVYFTLINIYEKTGKPTEALYYARKYINITDSLQGQDMQQAITRMQVKHEFESKLVKKEQEKEMLEIANKAALNKQKIITFFTLLGFLLVLTVALLIFRSFRQKQKANKLLEEKNNEITSKNHILNQQKEEITTQRDELEEQSRFLMKQGDKIFEQKTKIKEQSDLVKAKNDELQKIEQIVQAVNSQIHFEKVLNVFLQKICSFTSPDQGVALILDNKTNFFKHRAGFGVDLEKIKNLELSLDNIQKRYLENATLVFENIYYSNNVKCGKTDTELDLQKDPESMVAIVVKINDKIEGLLVISHTEKKDIFTEKDLSLINNLKNHIYSAFIKAQILESLQQTLDNLKATQEELIRKEKLASIGQLTKGIVDRVINPLNYINNFSGVTFELVQEIKESMLKESNLSEDGKMDVEDLTKMMEENLSKVQEHGQSATRIIKGMEKLLKEKSTIYISSDINTAIKNSIESTYAEYLKTEDAIKININFKFAQNLKQINILPFEFSQAINYIVNNSFYALKQKNEKQKGFVPELIISTEDVDNEINIKIHDNGKGMPEKEMIQLFSPFFTTKPTAKGIGLGLYMTKEIIKEHKGTIVSTSVENQFTEITINLPK